mgnify:CR=1 FL=1
MQYVEKIRATVESLLFITNEPLTIAQICELAELEEDDVLDVLDWLIDDYSDASKGIGVIISWQSSRIICHMWKNCIARRLAHCPWLHWKHWPLLRTNNR